MREHVYWQSWQKIVYRQTKLGDGLSYWSRWIEVEADNTIKFKESRSSHDGIFNWLLKKYFCNQYAVFKPIGHRDVKFRLGFCSRDYVTKLSPLEQKVSDGIFAVRMWSAPRHYFIVGNGGVDLHLYTKIYRGSPVAKKYDDLVIY